MGLDTSLKAAEWIFKQECLGTDDIQILRKEIFQFFSIEKIYEASEDTSLFVRGVNSELDRLEDQIQVEYKQLEIWIKDRAASISMATDIFKIEFKEKSLVIKAPRAAIQTLKASGKLPTDCTAVVNKSYSYLESTTLDKAFALLSKLRDSLTKQQSIVLVEKGLYLSNLLFLEWMRLTDIITQTDVNLTLARIALDLGYVRPKILELPEGSVDIEGLRHPLLEAQDKKIPYVQHNIDLGVKKQGWLLYGLNASGKSSLMRATGLAVLLAQGGSFVPASKMTLSPFTSLHTRIINTDNLWMGLSSFAVEMSEMRDIFLHSGHRSLVLGDELCSGTETTSATALVAAGLKGLFKRGARFLFATHLHGLSQIEQVAKDSRLSIKHLHVEYDTLKDRLVYHRTLRDGSGSSLYGLEVAKAMRIPDDILEDAISFRKQLTGESDRSLSVGSSWNSSVVRIVCEACGSTESADLEVHHIKERHTAVKGRLEDGSDVHSAANLAVLCDTCHDSVHSGMLSVGPFTMTSDGPERSVTVAESIDRKSKWSEEEETIIQSVCNKFKTTSSGNLSKYLLNQHNIQISGPTLRRFRS
jgi:DNA mismatch repair protein MutS